MCFGLSGVALFWLDKALEAGWNLDGQTGVLCVNLVFLQLGVVWATWWLIRDHGMSWQQAFGLSVSNPARICRFALQAALLGFLVASFLGGMIQMSLEALGQEASSGNCSFVPRKHSPRKRIIIALTAVLLAPLVEELLFEEWFYRPPSIPASFLGLCLEFPFLWVGPFQCGQFVALKYPGGPLCLVLRKNR